MPLTTLARDEASSEQSLNSVSRLSEIEPAIADNLVDITRTTHQVLPEGRTMRTRDHSAGHSIASLAIVSSPSQAN